MFPTSLRNFVRSEFDYPDMMNPLFLNWLDRVRERAGVVMVLTDDARISGDPEPSGSAKGKSLHHRGCAVDFRIRNLSEVELFKIIAAVFDLRNETPEGWKVELELVKGPTDQHGHLGLDWTPGKEHELILAND